MPSIDTDPIDHTHPSPHPGRGGHIFYSIVSALTVTHYFEGCDCIGEPIAEAIDFFNPLAIPNEVITIIEEQ